MNFKYLVIAIYLTFVGLIVMMVMKSCNQKIDLETKNYYNEELKFQEQIDAKMAGNPYLDSFKVLEQGEMVLIAYPGSLVSDSVSLSFKKPDNASADKHYCLKAPKLELPKKDFVSGYYDLDIRVYKSGKPLLVEKKVKF